ncbi:tripeptidyl-peptidase 2-like isoform X3 [Corticium candelabrum]|uniref:tripeptidyl-peptidase 2-like isoform X3 n=1 Tax=Corticium candelabrum TaxID=121492 RepID=UPI002E2673EE|nr:tripeptidyl-peptidase 2-like isoform X3 [Corticium candelabrum]
MDGDFPLKALLPKKETGAESFLARNPDFDGRGITIAILDTGVDPGAPGLQVTTDGRQKILDLIDATGSGDVDTSTVLTTEEVEERSIKSPFTGRDLKIPSDWQNPSGRWHVGVKSAYELFPKLLRTRLNTEIKKKLWDPAHERSLAVAAQELDHWNDEHSDKTATLTRNEKLMKEELEYRVELLTKFDKEQDIAGPVYDCIVFHDGNTWRAVIDSNENGDLLSASVLSSFRESGQYATFGGQDLMNYSINVYDNGRVLSVVTTCGSHGTHVASIAAGNFPDEPALNGVAPGAQIVSVKIGDSRLDSMETGRALVNGVSAIVAHKCDIANLSFGEGAHWHNAGCVVEAMAELTQKYGIIFVSSAGNNGPALSTVGCPGGTESSVIGIGALVTPDMMDVEYSMRERLPINQYTWSSRGPTIDGALGVSVSAPGGAIASVPNWTLKGSQLMNGTSMSSPNACGGIALIMSGLKASGITYSPSSVKQGIENTASPVEGLDKLTVGHGLLQVDKAFEYIKEHGINLARDVTFEVSVDGSRRGIYLRESCSLQKPIVASVKVEPKYNDDAERADRIKLQLKLNVACDASWVSAPSHLVLMNTARQFSVRVDPRGLNSGYHFSEVCAYNADFPSQGPLFRVPVTVIIPEKIGLEAGYCRSDKLQFKPGQVHRMFLEIPHGATWAEVSLVAKVSTGSATFFVHAIQLQNDCDYRSHEFDKRAVLSDGSHWLQQFKVLGGVTLELSVAQYWASLGDSEVTRTITVHGIMSNPSEITFHSSKAYTRVDVTASFRQEEIQPSGSLKTHIEPLRPVDSAIRCMGEQDVLPSGCHVYQLILTYTFSKAKKGEVVPAASYLSNLLYESEYESQLWMLFDSNKQLITCGDAFPHKYAVTIDKGDYTLRLQVCHSRREQLERLKDMIIVIKHKLPSPVSVDVYGSLTQAMRASGSKCKSLKLGPGNCIPLYIMPPAEDKIPKAVKPGHILQGTMSFAKDSEVKKVDSCLFSYVISEPPLKRVKSKQDKAQKTTLSLSDQYEEALRSFQLTWACKLKDLQQVDEVEKQAVDPLEARLTRLRILEEKERLSHLDAIVATANAVLDCIDIVQLAAYCGMKADLSSDADTVKWCDMDKKKAAVIEALGTKVLVVN